MGIDLGVNNLYLVCVLFFTTIVNLGGQEEQYNSGLNLATVVASIYIYLSSIIPLNNM